MERRVRGIAKSPKVGASDSRGFAGPEAFPKANPRLALILLFLLLDSSAIALYN